MYRPKDDIVTFYYNSRYCDKDRLSEVESDRSYDIYAEFISNQVMELEEYNTLCDEFKEFLRSYKSGDIVEVVEKLNVILKDVPQKRLRVTISGKTDDNIQTVEYIDGLLEFYYFSRQCWDDTVYVCKKYNGIDIKFQKAGINVQSIEDVNDIYKELNQIFAKVFKLQELEKGKNPSITRHQN